MAAATISSGPPTPGSGAGGPPSRPATSMSNMSDIDDLLGPPAPRSRGGAKTKKKGRYVDVMAKGN
jgi:COPII coat assembly protein SEC16